MLSVLLVALVLAFANGANDNFKGVATLLGSRTTGYRRALLFATGATFLGSVAAVLLAGELLARFQGKGLVPPEVAADPGFVTAVALGAGSTVLLATLVGMPTSTTHALIGALVGAGLAVSGPVETGVLAVKFALPLLASPVLAMGGTMLVYPLFRSARRRLGVGRTTCLCVGHETVQAVSVMTSALAEARARELTATLGETVTCSTRYDGRLLGLRAGRVLDALHYVSAGATSFARGLNDTPKIAAVLLVVPAMDGPRAILACGGAIAVGGWLAAHRVARTMSYEITSMNAGQGFTSNLVTSVLVLAASPLGLPVSTTHVSNGALFGLGVTTGGARWRTISGIVLTWVVTLPLAGVLAFAVA